MCISSRVVLLIGHERAGTNLLRSILQTHSDICCYGEICNCGDGIEAAKAFTANFFNYKVKAYTADESMIYPVEEHQERLLKGYFEDLCQNSGSRVILVDIKYGHIHNFNTFWTSWLGTPFLLRFVTEKNIRVIHLYRKNLLEAVCSTFLAQARSVWNTDKPEELENVRIHVDPARAKRRVSVLDHEKEMIMGYLPNYQTLTLVYEQMLVEGVLNPMVSEALARFLGVSEEWNAVPKLVKVSPPLSEYVENYDEFRRMFFDTKFASCIQ